MKAYTPDHGNLHLSELALSDEPASLTEKAFYQAKALCAANDFAGIVAFLTANGINADACVYSDRDAILAGKRLAELDEAYAQGRDAYDADGIADRTNEFEEMYS